MIAFNRLGGKVAARPRRRRDRTGHRQALRWPRGEGRGLDLHPVGDGLVGVGGNVTRETATAETSLLLADDFGVVHVAFQIAWDARPSSADGGGLCRPT
jgi:hypothetical protein